MSWYNKVVWSEGLFMRPQLFQQQERYLEHYSHRRAAPLSPFFFGFSDIKLDSEALALGKVIVKSAIGVFADGTPFDAPGSTPPPLPLSIRAEHLDQLIYLAVPIRVPNGEETTFDDAPDSLARHRVFDTDLRDANSIGQGPKTVQLSNLRLRLVPEKELTDGWIGLALTRVKTIRADASIELDDALIPPVSAYGASSQLTSWLARIHELTRLRANALALRLAGGDGNAGVAAEVSDYLLLQTLNRYEPLLQHFRQVPAKSPADLYALLIGMAGELSTYVRTDTRRPLDSHPAYLHTEPHVCLKPVVDDTHRLLNAVLVRSAQRIEFRDQGYGMHNAVVEPVDMQGFTALVLAVFAEMPSDILQQQFAAQAKAGPSERLPDLVRAHLPGMALQALPVPPRQIPFNAGYVYYELTRNGPLWDEVARHGGIALHVAGDFPGLRVEMWGVRG
ncbi:type VI secretion system baseplate subunit TssK [Burkholderia stagnalis]|uniref:Type VI secretion system baseplate subunit TssK n=1 Tax=Burkholderia stagnalis TaxID=1503054 RepID=A0ABX9YPI0_9BURK|nr:type VI secretion system baseplate subunit TssK [Burkholderia stagnalis]AOK55657.1 type VI secretion protein [Burkholderia stagnalis]KVN68436.1 type VI secretion protein [Burkholderia stagnalis]KWO31663.1 type VI secretion protein [Burkholderia stagnalis]KWO36012.1 type VI secretion protein [Burkholderia stagnalis]RQQ58299.1 type VI secretion system baseplate subunit TssK [Burkholderia stagnalis]